MILTIAPIGQGRIPVYADKTDRRIGPERVKMKPHLTAAIIGLVAIIFGPVRRIGQGGDGSNQAAAILGQGAQGLNRWIGIASPPDLANAA